MRSLGSTEQAHSPDHVIMSCAINQNDTPDEGSDTSTSEDSSCSRCRSERLVIVAAKATT